MPDNDVAEKSQRLVQLMQKHLGTRGQTLETVVRRAGRRLPKALRAEAQVLIEAQKMAAHPKLMRRVDENAVASAYQALEIHLTQIDLAEQRKTKVLNMGAGLALNLILLLVAVLVVLKWRGLV